MQPWIIEQIREEEDEKFLAEVAEHTLTVTSAEGETAIVEITKETAEEMLKEPDVFKVVRVIRCCFVWLFDLFSEKLKGIRYSKSLYYITILYYMPYSDRVSS